MENSKKATTLNILVITGKLVIITCIIATMIAVINSFTAPVIANNEQAAKNDAIMQIFPEATKTEALSERVEPAYPEDITEVYLVYKEETLIGYCVDTLGMGFADNITMMVGVDMNIAVVGIRVLSIADTPGIGLAVAEDDYLSTFTGATPPVVFGENNVDAITGATYSSRGILDGVNVALDFCDSIVNEMPTAVGDTQTDDVTETESASDSEEVTDVE